MSYYLRKEISGQSMPEVIDRTTEALKTEGFGILTTIDMKATLKAKIDADIEPYTILGACNPNFANQALQKEENIGVFLPCNVLVKQKPDYFEIVAVDPISSMTAVPNKDLLSFAEEVKSMLSRALDRV